MGKAWNVFPLRKGKAGPWRRGVTDLDFVQKCNFVFILRPIDLLMSFAWRATNVLIHFVRDLVFRKQFLFLHVCRAEWENCSQYGTDEE